MTVTARHFRFAAYCVCLFLATQIFQALCLLFWLPGMETAADDLMARVSWLDQVRNAAVLTGIVLLTVPYTVITIARLPTAPLASVLGFVFAMFFVAIELVSRGIDLILVSRQWAVEFATATAVARETILGQHALWNQATHGFYFPLLLSWLLGSLCFAIATWRGEGRWHRLASLAFALNALRILARLLGSYAGVAWLAPFNGLSTYLPSVVTINALLAAWLFWSAAQRSREYARG